MSDSNQASTVIQWFRDRALTLVLVGFFLVLLVGQFITGFFEYNATRVEHGQAAVAVGSYFSTGHLWEAVFENWRRPPALSSGSI